MRAREGEQQDGATAPEQRGQALSAASPEQAVLVLQRGAGNAAVGQMIQRWGLPDWLPTPTDPLAAPFEVAMQTNRAMADRITVPAHYREKLLEYADEKSVDGVILKRALARSPRFYKGGWILDVQTDAKAMTLDNYVFVNGDLDIGTYIHELVHVTQYAVLGRTHFLTSYFGLSAFTIAKRFIMRESIDMMESSPHEVQAYELEKRFKAWYAAHR